MSDIEKQLAQAQSMLEEVESSISSKLRQDIQKRLATWTKYSEVQSGQHKEALPLLVMSSSGIPRPLNPLYFKFKKQI